MGMLEIAGVGRLTTIDMVMDDNSSGAHQRLTLESNALTIHEL